MEKTSERLVYIRELRGYTQTSLANAIGVSRGVIGNIEYGQNEPLPIVANAICDELGINKEWLLFGTGPMEPEINNSPVVDDLVAVASRLPDWLVAILVDTARSMEKHCAQDNQTE